MIVDRRNPKPFSYDDAIRMFHYRDGMLYWIDCKNPAFNGKPAGINRADGYRTIFANGKHYLAHRLIYLMHHGSMPKKIDHIDRNPTNNRIENLRAATDKLNAFNKSQKSDIRSGAVGVYWYKRMNCWRADVAGRTIGYFKDKNDALTARENGAKAYLSAIL